MKIESWMVMEIIFYAMVASAGVLFTVLAIYIPKFFEVYEKDKLGEYEVETKDSAGFKATLDTSAIDEKLDEFYKDKNCTLCDKFDPDLQRCEFTDLLIENPLRQNCTHFIKHSSIETEPLKDFNERLKRGERCSECARFDKNSMLCNDIAKGLPKHFVAEPVKSVCSRFKSKPELSPETNCTTCSHFDKLSNMCLRPRHGGVLYRPEVSICDDYEKGV